MSRLEISSLADYRMKTRTIDFKRLEAAFARMVEEKRIIQDHVAQGKDLSELSAKGIRFVMPVSL